VLSDLYQQMVLIRNFEEETLRLAADGLIPGAVHPCTGHEAVAVGALAHRNPHEWVVGYYRCHGHALASGCSPEPLLREMLDRAGGICGAKGGSMHLSDGSHNFLGASSIVASQLAIAAGVAMAEKIAGLRRAVIVFSGDGALGAGVAYESLMIALQYALPLLVVFEDNGWQDHTPSDLVMPVPPARLLANLGLPTQEVDGNEVTDVTTAAQSALAACRGGKGPQALVARTYLRHFHSQLGDAVPGEYRPAEELAHWLDRDPVILTAARLRRSGVDPEPLHQAAVRTVELAVEGALSAPEPRPETALTAVTVAEWPEQ
jgi:acetoin:2,6-dichlorophenolindophenol oxidoreductase subunit alpha